MRIHLARFSLHKLFTFLSYLNISTLKKNPYKCVGKFNESDIASEASMYYFTRFLLCIQQTDSLFYIYIYINKRRAQRKYPICKINCFPFFLFLLLFSFRLCFIILLVFAFVNIIGLYHDLIFSREPSLKTNHGEKASQFNRYTRALINGSISYKRIAYFLTILNRTEVLIEMIILKQHGSKKRWDVVTILEIIK